MQQTIPLDVHNFMLDVFQQTGIELSLQEQAALYAEVAGEIEETDKPPIWTPINELQRLAMASPAQEIYCGGRARTGKTDLIIGAALTEHNNSIIFRTQFTQITELRNRTREILRGTGASYNGNEKIWKDIPGDRVLEFGAIKNDADVDKYYGRPHDLICFDEIPKFREEHYLTLWAWACSTDRNQRVRIICTGNPPTSAKELWVKQRWAAWVDPRHPNRAKPGELRWYVNLDGRDTEVESEDTVVTDAMGKPLKPTSRTFIPGELLHFYKGTDYEARLDALPEKMRRALRDGDFSVAEDDQVHQVIPTEHVMLAFERWERMQRPDVPLRGLGVDVARGGTDQTIIAKRYGNYFEELLKYAASETKTGNDVAAAVLECMQGEPKSARIVIDLTGVGSSPYDILISHGFNVDGFTAAAKSPYTDEAGMLEFRNRRSESWWKFREALDPNSKSFQAIALPPDNELLADLTAPTFEVDTQGIVIEPKESIIKRLGRSPDCGDAVVMNYNIDVRSADNIDFF